MRRSSAGFIPSRVRKPCTPSDRLFLGRPASHRTTFLRHLPRTRAALSPAGPPPTIWTSRIFIQPTGDEAVPLTVRGDFLRRTRSFRVSWNFLNIGDLAFRTNNHADHRELHVHHSLSVARGRSCRHDHRRNQRLFRPAAAGCHLSTTPHPSPVRSDEP